MGVREYFSWYEPGGKAHSVPTGAENLPDPSVTRGPSVLSSQERYVLFNSLSGLIHYNTKFNRSVNQ